MNINKIEGPVIRIQEFIIVFELSLYGKAHVFDSNEKYLTTTETLDVDSAKSLNKLFESLRFSNKLENLLKED